MANGISRDTFDGMDVDSKLGVLFDYALESHSCACDMRDKMEALENRFEKRKRVDTAVAGAGGVIGGVLSFLGLKLGV
jgi:hypothetical protein